MRRMYLVVLLWSVLSAVMAQSEYRQAADQAFANLDKNGITTGILYDRVFPAANLRESGTTSSAGHFQQAQSELYQASYNTQNRLTPDDLSSLTWQSQQQGITPIGVLIAGFQVLNFDAIQLDGNNR